MTSNLQSTTSHEDLRRATETREPQPRERQRRPAPTLNRPVAKPGVSGSSTQPQTSTKAPADFDPSSSREALIATAAYYRAQRRGFQPGHELLDWLAAEREIDGVGTDAI
jgi:hypothetical protein